MANDDMVLTTFVKYVKEFDFQLMCLGDKVVVSQKRLVKFFIKGLRPKALAETVEFQLPETLVDAKRLAKQALPELRFAREQAKRFAVIDSDSKSGADKPKGNQKPLNSSPPSQRKGFIRGHLLCLWSEGPLRQQAQERRRKRIG
jgi:hypothetical protein